MKTMTWVGVFSLMVVSKSAVHLFAFLGFNLPQVELQFFALKDVAISPAALSWSGWNAGQKLALQELLLQQRTDLGCFSAQSKLLLDLFGPLLVQDFLFLRGQFSSLLPAKWEGIVRLIPLSVRSAVHQNNTVLHQGLGSHQLVVWSIVDHINDPGLAGTAFWPPWEVSHIEPQGTVFLVSTTDSYCVDAARSNLGVCCRTPELILPFLVDGLAFATGPAAFVPVIPWDTCGVEIEMR